MYVVLEIITRSLCLVVKPVVEKKQLFSQNIVFKLVQTSENSDALNVYRLILALGLLSLAKGGLNM